MARILVVEDTELLRRMYQDKLEQDGFEVVTAADGLEALAALKADAFDLVLLDLIMPRMSGLEVIDIMKKDPRTANVPVVILSNLGQDDDIRRGLELGASDYMVKNAARPADVADKIRATLKLMSGRALQAESFKVFLRDRDGDADALVQHASLPRRFWCPACETELVLEMLPTSTREGWYEAHFLCAKCNRAY